MYEQEIETYLSHEIETIKALDIRTIDAAIQLIRETYQREGRIYVFGNGGSSATASHWQNDFNKGVSEYLEKKFHFYFAYEDLNQPYYHIHLYPS